jgi:hypothetical protein
VVIAPSLDAEVSVKAFKTKKKIEEFTLVAGGHQAANAYGVESYPTIFVVGKDGKVAWKGENLNAAATQAIEAALAAKAPPPKADPQKK